MKSRYIFVSITIFILGIGNAYASSITYDLTIDDEFNFNETITYNVDYDDIDRSSYNFLTSVVDDDIYFDSNESVKYDKTKKNNGNQYIVTLKNDYSQIFLSGSRILNECFGDFEVETDDNNLSFKSEAPFFCSHRADTITAKIKTDLNVISSNADKVSNNIYIWNVDDKNFNMKFNVEIPELEVANEDGLGTDFVPEENNDGENNDIENNTTENENDETYINEEETEEENKTGIIPIVIVIAIISIIGIILFIILKRRKNKLNQI